MRDELWRTSAQPLGHSVRPILVGSLLSHGNIKITDDNGTEKSGDILRMNQKVLMGADRNVGTTFFLG